MTDPPYEFQTSGGGIFRNKRHNMDQIAESKLDQGFNIELLSASQFGCISVFCHNDQLLNLLKYADANYDRHAVLSWHTTNPMPVANKHYVPTEFWVHAWHKSHHPLEA